MADFNFFLNRQGIQGRKGEKGDTGFSPTISVGTDTLDEYKLIIANESNSFETPNLRGNINIQDNGGTYLRYDTETKQISAQNMDAATADTLGGVRLSTEADIVEMGAGSVVTPSDVADALPLYLEGEGAVTITQDELTSKTKIKVDVPSVNDLESRMSTAEAEIADIQTDVANLNNDKVAKTDLATTNSAGIVKVDGTSITVTEDGTISASPSGALPIASTTQLGGVKVDGTSIIADENGVISSVGGGGTGDVTANGNNVFTGNNEFTKSIRVKNPTDPFQRTFVNYNGLGIGTTSEAEIKAQNNQTLMPLKFIASKLTLSNAYDGSSESPIITSDKLKAGENITLDKNTETGDITISSTGGGGTGDVPIATTTTAGKVKPDGTTITVTDDGTISAAPSTPTNMVTTDSRQTVNGTKIFANRTGTVFTGTSSNSNSLTIDGDDKEIRFNSANQSDAVIKNQGWDSANLNIGTNFNSVKITTTLYDKNGNEITGGGGSSAPENMVTTDTVQDITGKKTIVNSDGLCFKSTNSLNTSVTAQIVNTSSSVPNTIGKVTISPDKSSGSRNGFARISYGILNDGNSSNPLYGKGGLQVTPVVDDTSAEARILLGNPYDGMGNIVGTTSGLTIGTGAVGSELSITSTDITFNGQSLLNSGGAAPENMVTTDTDQIITGAKTFTNSITFNNTLNMSTANTDTLYIHSSGSYAQGYTTDIDVHKNLNIKTGLSGGAITLIPYNDSLNALKYKNSDRTDNPSYDILHTGNLVTGGNIAISEPNSTGVRTISGPSNEYMASMAFPSSKYVDLTLGASGSTYTAPADGWYYIEANIPEKSYKIRIESSNPAVYKSQVRAINPNEYCCCPMLPIKKGESAVVHYDGSLSARFVFIYAEGSK